MGSGVLPFPELEGFPPITLSVLFRPFLLVGMSPNTSKYAKYCDLEMKGILLEHDYNRRPSKILPESRSIMECMVYMELSRKVREHVPCKMHCQKTSSPNLQNPDYLVQCVSKPSHTSLPDIGKRYRISHPHLVSSLQEIIPSFTSPLLNPPWFTEQWEPFTSSFEWILGLLR